ncbi:aspartate dehydrogenase [Terrarubrum flagellatum]|uniref:aspartate dehydrogenase n=1 Tax=Terrirubrum flagellatum TaxID=2895980 RepID=UPI003145633A
MKIIGMIGFGAIGELVAKYLSEAGSIQLGPVLMRPGRAVAIAAKLPKPGWPCEDVDALIRARPSLVVECAGQEALRAHGAAILAAGIDLMPIATGVFADHDFRQRMIETARASGARILIPAGATAGLDGLGALAVGGLDRVIYTSIKPPHAWRGTPAEQAIDLDRVTTATIFYEGPADQAALAYPRNANLAATVALAGAGFERTIVRLVADPAATGNGSAIEAEGAFGRLSVKLSGPAMADNPRTSAVTALSIVRALRNEAGTFVI